MGQPSDVCPVPFPSFLSLSLPKPLSPPPVLAHLLSMNKVAFLERHFLTTPQTETPIRNPTSLQPLTHLIFFHRSYTPSPSHPIVYWLCLSQENKSAEWAGTLFSTKFQMFETVHMELSYKYLLKQMNGVNDLGIPGATWVTKTLPCPFQGEASCGWRQFGFAKVEN